MISVTMRNKSELFLTFGLPNLKVLGELLNILLFRMDLLFWITCKNCYDFNRSVAFGKCSEIYIKRLNNLIDRLNLNRIIMR